MLQEPQYTKNQVYNAGKQIVKKDISPEIKKQCLQIIDNWRASHAYPMHAIANTLKKKLKKHKNILIAQRLKRLDTILDKLNRFPQMNLSRMQDLGGCRVIFNSLDELKAFRDTLMRSKIKHNLSNEKNYIKEPNPDTGYRGIHLIYKYNSSKTPQYNDLLIEVQLRTRLQHLWATAVETVGMFTQNRLKFNQGDDVWLRFFKLVSIIFAAEEEKKTFKSIDKIKQHFEIISELLEIFNKHDIIKRLYSFTIIDPILNCSKNTMKSGYYLLHLNAQKNTLTTKWYKETEREFNIAIDDYEKLESLKKNNEDVVLVAAKNLRALMKAYPNYFSNISEFNDSLLKYMGNQIEKCKSFIDKKTKEKKMKTYFIIHGTMGHNQENWFGWLENALKSKGFEVYNFNYPTPEGHNFENWSKILDQVKDKINSQSIFICHSSAPIFLIKYCIKNVLKIGKLISVSGANNFKVGNPDFDNINKHMFVENVEPFKNLCKERVCIYSKNDPYISLEALQDFAKSIYAKEIVYDNAGHFNESAGYTKFEDLLKLI